MRYFDGNKYARSAYHGVWKYALLEYGKGMDAEGKTRAYHFKQALQILNTVPGTTDAPGVTEADVEEKLALIDEIEQYM